MAFDRDTFMIMINNNTDTFNKLISMARKEVPLVFERIGKAIASCNYKDIILYAHELKGVSSNLMALKLMSAAMEMEDSAREKMKPERLLKIFESMDSLFKEYIAAVEDEKSSQ